MSRDLTTAMQGVTTASRVRPALLFAGYFDSGVVYAWSGYGDLSWNGQIWKGTGTLLGVTTVEETEDVQATGTQFTLTGIPSELLSLALSENYQGRICELYLAAFDDSNAIVADPCKIFRGRMDVMTVDLSLPTSSIFLTAENRLVDLERPRVHNYTDQDQQAAFPGDLGMAFVTSLQDETIVWNK